jgi:hypothetical protein
VLTEPGTAILWFSITSAAPNRLVDVGQDGCLLDGVPPNGGRFNVDEVHRTTGPNQRRKVVDDGLLGP